VEVCAVMANNKSLPRSFWGFYWSLATWAISEGYGVLDAFLTFVAVGLFIVTLLNKGIAKQLESNWNGLSRWYSVIPLACLFGYRMMRANYAHFEDVVKTVDSLNEDIATERSKTLQPELGLVWGWPERYRNNMQQFERGSERFILVHNRSTDYMHNIQVQPIVLESRVEFDLIPEIAPSMTAEAVGRWDSRNNPGQKNSSFTTNFVYFFADNEAKGTELGWYQRKPHNRGLADVWWKVPITVSYQARGTAWESTFEFTYDTGDESWFSLVSSKRI
jgi:hypothetical protein